MMAKSSVHKVLRTKTVNHFEKFVFNACKTGVLFGVVMLVVMIPGGING